MKVLIIVLVIVVVLFIVLAVWGHNNNNSASSSNTNQDNFDPEQFSFLRTFDTVLGRFGPKLHLAVKTYDLSNLSDVSPMRATVPEDPDHKFRTAKFHLTPTSQKGCAKIEYKAPDGDGDKLNHQTWPDDKHHPFASEVPKKEISFTIVQSGGTITFTHASSSLKPCVVETE